MRAVRSPLGVLIVLVSAGLFANEAQANEHDASIALLDWNNFIEAINFSDSCSGGNDMAALRPLSARIEKAMSNLANRYPQPGLAGDTDYICDLARPTKRTGHRALRRRAVTLIERIEIEAAR